ncbi:hypothetical protein [Egbenema bharatensis]
MGDYPISQSKSKVEAQSCMTNDWPMRLNQESKGITPVCLRLWLWIVR